MKKNFIGLFLFVAGVFLFVCPSSAFIFDGNNFTMPEGNIDQGEEKRDGSFSIGNLQELFANADNNANRGSNGNTGMGPLLGAFDSSLPLTYTPAIQNRNFKIPDSTHISLPSGISQSALLNTALTSPDALSRAPAIALFDNKSMHTFLSSFANSVTNSSVAQEAVIGIVRQNLHLLSLPELTALSINPYTPPLLKDDILDSEDRFDASRVSLSAKPDKEDSSRGVFYYNDSGGGYSEFLSPESEEKLDKLPKESGKQSSDSDPQVRNLSNIPRELVIMAKSSTKMSKIGRAGRDIGISKSEIKGSRAKVNNLREVTAGNRTAVVLASARADREGGPDGPEEKPNKLASETAIASKVQEDSSSGQAEKEMVEEPKGDSSGYSPRQNVTQDSKVALIVHKIELAHNHFIKETIKGIKRASRVNSGNSGLDIKGIYLRHLMEFKGAIDNIVENSDAETSFSINLGNGRLFNFLKLPVLQGAKHK